MYKRVLFFLLLTIHTVHAQQSKSRSFTQGYLVQLNGDTLRGNMAALSEEESCGRIEFKKNNIDTVTIYSPDNVLLYKREGSVYVTKKIKDSKNQFVKVLEKGKINLYRYSFEYTKFGSSGEKTVDKSGPVEITHSTKPIEKSYDYYLEKITDDLKRISRQNQKGDLWNFFKGNDEMVKKVKSTKMEYDEIPALIKDYNSTHK